MLTIRLTKKPAGEAVLACTRADGSQTWQRHRNGFFPLHDLGHHAAETVLGLRHGFFGLVAAGWDVADFGERPIPPEHEAEAVYTECLVGLLDQERGTGHTPDADGFNEALRMSLESLGRTPDRPLATEELEAVRQRLAEHAAAWAVLPVGESLVLRFP